MQDDTGKTFSVTLLLAGCISLSDSMINIDYNYKWKYALTQILHFWKYVLQIFMYAYLSMSVFISISVYVYKYV